MKLREPESSRPGRAVYLVVVLLGLLLGQRLFELRLDGLRVAFRWVSRPLYWPFEALQGVGQGVADQLADSTRLQRQLEEATRRAADAELRARLGEEARLEAERLKQALGVLGATRGRVPGEPVFAHVVGRSPHPHERRITLDRGTRHGVRVDSPVIYGEDLLGRVIQVLPDRCRVLLLEDPLSALGVLIEGDRSPGVVRGTGGPTLELSDLPEDTRLEEGGRVLTGSLSAYYPKGLVVGTLEPEGEGWQVRPRQDLVRLEEAFILSLGHGETRSLAASPATSSTTAP